MKIPITISSEFVLYAASLLGVMVSAISGSLVAGRKRFDWLGVVVIAMVTALGGGTLRDVLLARHPIFWIRDPNFIWTSLAAAGLTLVFVRYVAPPKHLLLGADALGLAFFTISGAQLSAQTGAPALVVVLMATTTGAAGGVLRDLLTGEVPLLFRQGELYATASVVGAALYLWLMNAGSEKSVAALTGMATIAILRFAAILWRIRLPVFELAENNRPPSD